MIFKMSINTFALYTLILETKNNLFIYFKYINTGTKIADNNN